MEFKMEHLDRYAIIEKPCTIIVKNNTMGQTIISNWMKLYNPDKWIFFANKWLADSDWAAEDYEQGAFIKYILTSYNYKNYDNYLLGLIIKYYLSNVLDTYCFVYNTNNLVSNTYNLVISPILYNAIINKNIYIMDLIFNMKETTKSNIFKLIISEIELSTISGETHALINPIQLLFLYL